MFLGATNLVIKTDKICSSVPVQSPDSSPPGPGRVPVVLVLTAV